MDYVTFVTFCLATFLALLLANGSRWALLGIVPIAVAAPVVVAVARAGMANRGLLTPMLLGIAAGALAHWMLAFVYRRHHAPATEAPTAPEPVESAAGPEKRGAAKFTSVARAKLAAAATRIDTRPKPDLSATGRRPKVR